MSAPLQREPYLPSGRPGRALLLPALGLLSAAAVGFLYGSLQAHTLCVGFGPKLFVVWLLARGAMTFGFALAVTAPVVLGGCLLQVRDALTMRIYGAATGAFAVYFAWILFVWQSIALWRPTDAPPLAFWCQHPDLVAGAVRALAADGLHTIATGLGESWSPTGLLLWVPWAIEAVVVIALCVRAAPRFVRGRGYCEDCGRWLRPRPPLVVAADSTTGASPRDVRRGGLAALQAVEPPPRDALRTLRIDDQRCPGCARGLWGVLEQLHYVHQSPLRALLTQTIWWDVVGLRSEAKAGNIVVPLCWQNDGDRAELDRIAAALAAHPLTPALRRRR